MQQSSSTNSLHALPCISFFYCMGSNHHIISSIVDVLHFPFNKAFLIHGYKKIDDGLISITEMLWISGHPSAERVFSSIKRIFGECVY